MRGFKFQTELVYGIICNLLSGKSPKKVKEVSNRVGLWYNLQLTTLLTSYLYLISFKPSWFMV